MRIIVLISVVATAFAGAEGEKKQEGSEASPPLVVEPGRGEVDPFAIDQNPLGGGAARQIAPGRAGVKSETVVVRVELYDVKTATVIALLDSWKPKDGAGTLRRQALDLSKTGEAEVADVYATTVEAGAKHTFESIREYVYPTEYVPSGLDTLVPPKATPPKTLAELLDGLDETIIPSAFETRNTGSTLEIEVQEVEVDEALWDVSLAPEAVEVAGILEWGVLGAKMPQFTSLRSSTVVRVSDGEWTLVSTQTPHGDTGERRSDVKRMVFLKIERAR